MIGDPAEIAGCFVVPVGAALAVAVSAEIASVAEAFAGHTTDMECVAPEAYASPGQGLLGDNCRH